MIKVKQFTSHRIIFGLLSLFLPLAGLMPAAAASTPQVITLAWDDPNPASDVIGYKVHLGTQSGVYTQTLDTGNSSEAAFNNLTPGQTYYCAVTAYNASGLESAYSAEITFIATSTDTTLQVSNVKVEQTTPSGTPNVSITVNGQLGVSTEIRVEASNDMVQWEPLSVHPNQSGTIVLDDPGAKNQPKRFYRFVEN